MTLQKIEEHLFDRYKYWAKRQQSLLSSGVISHWEVIEELEKLLNELFDYDFPHANGKYYAIKNEEIVFEYSL